jgi:homoserine O-acetyltransferase
MSELTLEIFSAGDVELESGETLPDARVAYCVRGTLNGTKDNAIIMPTHFGGTHEHSQYLTGDGRALDPERYFIVTVNLIGNGVSSSPSNAGGVAFPVVTIADNVRLQRRLLIEMFGVQRLALAVGHSMGAVQAYHWAALYPNFVERVGAICGAAKISRHNDVFLQGMQGILTADPAWMDGHYDVQPLLGLRTMARAWGAWPPSSHFFRHAYYEKLGYSSVDDFMERYWEVTYTGMDANNVLAQIATWRSADISANELYKGDFEKALASITARVCVMPCISDAYFPPDDSEIEISHMNGAVLRPIRSQWGHWAGSGRNPEDTDFIDQQLKELLLN